MAMRRKRGQIERLSLVPLKNAIQRLTARVGEYEDRPPFVTRERQRLGCPRGIEFGCERVFVLKAPETLGRRLFRGRSVNYQEGRWVAALPAAVKREFRAFADWLQHVLRRPKVLSCARVEEFVHTAADASTPAGIGKCRTRSQASCGVQGCGTKQRTGCAVQDAERESGLQRGDT
jgi:hypothetical protein